MVSWQSQVEFDFDTQQTGGWVRPKVVRTVAATFDTDSNSGVTSLIRYHRSSFVHYTRPVLRHSTAADTLHAPTDTDIAYSWHLCSTWFIHYLRTWRPDTDSVFFQHILQTRFQPLCHITSSYISYFTMLFYLFIFWYVVRWAIELWIIKGLADCTGFERLE
jgi:hypothetical protein